MSLVFPSFSWFHWMLILLGAIVNSGCLFALYKIHGAEDSSSSHLDPEVVKQRTEQWTEEAAINPAFPADQGPSTNGVGRPNHGPPKPIPDDEPSDQQGRDQSKLDTTAMEFNWQAATDVSFEDVGGMEALKEELRVDVIKVLNNQEKAETLGVGTPNIVFHGPPGTGKTFTAKALATELGLPFAKLSGADLQSKWINESASMVNDLFTEAKEVAGKEGGAVIFLDELDSVLKNRSGSGSAHEEDNKVVNEFLNHLEDTKDHNIVFIGATNRIDALDDAGIRAGRVDKKIYIGKPDRAARKKILQVQLSDRPNNLSNDDIAELAAVTEGAVPSDLSSLVEEAAKQVLDRDGKKIQPGDFACKT